MTDLTKALAETLQPLPLARRQAMQEKGDYTVNAAGDKNRVGVMPLKRDFTTGLVDGFIRDGWTAPEDRMAELAALFQGQMNVAKRDLGDIYARLHREEYERGWISRMLDYWEFQPCLMT